jgi:outer membrane immunogenic protein
LIYLNPGLAREVLQRTWVSRLESPESRCCSFALSRGRILQFLSPGTHPVKRETEDQMIKKLLLASAASALLAGAASAADLPRRAAPPPVFTPVPVFTWTGAYFGINAGYAFDASNRNTGNVFGIPAPFATPGTVATFRNRSQDGFSGGAQIGYNYQFTPGSGVVVGIEADAQYLDFGRDRNNAFISGAVAPGLIVNDPRGLSSLDYFGTVRGRLGYAFDRTLVYGTGGFAYGSGSADRSFGGFAGNDSFRTGYAVGGGIEYALPTESFLNFFRSSAVTLKVEGLYVNLDRNTRNQGVLLVNAANLTPVLSTGIGRRSDEFAVVRAGLNYKFGSY